MVNVNVQTSYPLSPSVFDIVAETARISAQILRNNPMENSIVTRGLIKWLGHYPGNPLWIGEFLPYDPNQLDIHGNPRPQVGFALRRDDPVGATALALYDWDPRVGNPLRQRLWGSDADGRSTWREGESGGWGWPRFPVPMYSAPGIWSTRSSDGTQCFGRSQLVGRHLDWMFDISIVTLATVNTSEYGNVPFPLAFSGPSGSPVVSYYVEAIAGPTTITSPVQTTGGGFVNGTLDLKGMWMPEPSAYLSDYLVVNFHAWLSNAGSSPYNAFAVQPVFVHNVTLWTDRAVEGF